MKLFVWFSFKKSFCARSYRMYLVPESASLLMPFASRKMDLKDIGSTKKTRLMIKPGRRTFLRRR